MRFLIFSLCILLSACDKSHLENADSYRVPSNYKYNPTLPHPETKISLVCIDNVMHYESRRSGDIWPVPAKPQAGDKLDKSPYPYRLLPCQVGES